MEAPEKPSPDEKAGLQNVREAFEQAALEAFSPFAEIRSLTLAGTLAHAICYGRASTDGRRKITISPRALVLGMLDYGFVDGGSEGVAAAIANFLETRFTEVRERVVSNRSYNIDVRVTEPGAVQVELSHSLLTIIGEAQRHAARIAGAGAPIDLRHLAFELGAHPSAWDFLPEPLSDNDRWAMRRLVVETSASAPALDENPKSWWALLDGPTAPADTRTDRYRTQRDDPAQLDALEREPFAAVLAARIREARQVIGADQQDKAFMVHVHGPWGSGKSTLLNLLEKQLERPKDGSTPALVVWFNAWKHQRMRPPWWALLSAIYNAAVSEQSPVWTEWERREERWALRRLWWKWRLRADLLPGLLVALLLGGLVFVLLDGSVAGSVEPLLKVSAAIVTVAATLTASARFLAFGSAKTAQVYTDLSTDPFSPVIALFDKLVRTVRAELVVFIDDLDRCDSTYVVELLEGIQTLFRESPVTYVVAADRKWICTAFDTKYGDFCGRIGEPCRPLGYLFVDKMFQISAGLPRLTRSLQASYLDGLLAEGDALSAAPSPADTKAAAAEVAGVTDEAALLAVVAASKNKPVALQRAVRAAAAMQITSAEAAQGTEHRLRSVAHLIEPNPRSMKRLVNAVGMAQARGILEGRSASPETRARWAMLSLRWPVLAEFIAEHPETISYWAKAASDGRTDGPSDSEIGGWPTEVARLKGNKAVIEVVGAAGEPGALTPDSLVALLA